MTFGDAVIGGLMAVVGFFDRIGNAMRGNTNGPVWHTGSNDDQSDESPPEARLIPERFTIIPDPWQAEHVGVLADGRRYFVTADVDLLSDRGYVSVYYWSADGSFESADIDDVGALTGIKPRGLSAAARARHEQLAGATIEPITVAPFSVEKDGITFGFVAREPDPEFYPIASVTHLPNDDMVYYWPWDGEGYDT